MELVRVVIASLLIICMLSPEQAVTGRNLRKLDIDGNMGWPLGFQRVLMESKDDDGDPLDQERKEMLPAEENTKDDSVIASQEINAKVRQEVIPLKTKLDSKPTKNVQANSKDMKSKASKSLHAGHKAQHYHQAGKQGNAQNSKKSGASKMEDSPSTAGSQENAVKGIYRAPADGKNKEDVELKGDVWKTDPEEIIKEENEAINAEEKNMELNDKIVVKETEAKQNRGDKSVYIDEEEDIEVKDEDTNQKGQDSGQAGKQGNIQISKKSGASKMEDAPPKEGSQENAEIGIHRVPADEKSNKDVELKGDVQKTDPEEITKEENEAINPEEENEELNDKIMVKETEAKQNREDKSVHIGEEEDIEIKDEDMNHKDFAEGRLEDNNRDGREGKGVYVETEEEFKDSGEDIGERVENSMEQKVSAGEETTVRESTEGTSREDKQETEEMEAREGDKEDTSEDETREDTENTFKEDTSEDETREDTENTFKEDKEDTETRLPSTETKIGAMDDMASKGENPKETSPQDDVTDGGAGDDDDDYGYGMFFQDFSDLASKFQETASKVAGHLGPDIQNLADNSKLYLDRANQQIRESFSPLVGARGAPLIASIISYGLVLLPLVLVVILFERIRAILSLEKVLLCIHIYLASYFATLMLATFVLGSEPMVFFYKSSTRGFINLQLLQALAYIVYLILQTFTTTRACLPEPLGVRLMVVFQWLVAAMVGLHYYVTVFHRALVGKVPHASWQVYALYSFLFAVLRFFCNLKWTKKEYSHSGVTDTHKKS